MMPRPGSKNGAGGMSLGYPGKMLNRYVRLFGRGDMA